MTRLAALMALLSVAPLLGQTKEVVEEVNALLEQQRIAARHADERNEDIEVLRRLLNKSFGFDHKTGLLLEHPATFGGGGFSTGTGFPSAGGAAAVKRPTQMVGPFDGVYLKGVGVVFTLRVPKDDTPGTPVCVGSPHGAIGLNTSCGKCHQDGKGVHAGAKGTDCYTCHAAGTVSASTVQPLSDWDRIRADVRGEKPPEVKPLAIDPKKPRAAMCKPGDIRELLTAELFAHAKNLRNLDKNDWVTVVVTFDELPGAKASPIPSPTGKPGLNPDELQALTLADLHLKQGKYKEAAEAYEKGLARYAVPVVKLTFPPSLTAAEVQKAIRDTETAVRGVYKSLATAYLHLNQLEKAQAAVALAAVLKVEVAPPGGEKLKPQLPAKIHLAVCKSDLDRVKTLDEFRKAVHLELIGFPPAEKK